MSKESNEIANRSFDYLEDVSAAIGEAINNLSSKLGVASEHVYGVLVKQQVIEAISHLVVLSFFILLFLFSVKYLFLKVFMSIYREKVEKYPRMEDAFNTVRIIIWVGVIIATITLCIVFVVVVPEAIQKIINPEYFALKDILNQISRLTN